MTTRVAECACGALRATAYGAASRQSVCHCLNCKRRSGSAFAWTATYAADRVEVSGEYGTWQRHSDEGRWARFHFCRTCGTTIWYQIELRPDMISIPAGTFADPDSPAPDIEVYEDRRCPWVAPLPDQAAMPSN
jgi:hypothetical protein